MMKYITAPRKLAALLPLFIFVTFAITNSASAQSTPPPPAKAGHDHEKGGEPKMTKEQKESIKKIRTASMKEMMALRNQIDEKKAHLKTLETADKPDMGAINSTIDELSALTGQMMKKRSAERQEIRKLLTDEQRIAFDMRAERNKEGRGDRKMGKRGPHGPEGKPGRPDDAPAKD